MKAYGINRSVPALLLTLIFICILMFFPSLCSDGVKTGIDCCMEMLIPSLFPFMVLSSFFMRSGASGLAGRIIGAPICAVSYLPRCCAAAILLSFTGGFPVGAKCISILYEQGSISRREAERMSLYCVCSGPAFLITAIGAMMLHNTAAGVILYASQLISGIVICAAAGIAARLKKESVSSEKQSNKQSGSPSDSFVEAVADGTNAAIAMCALVLVFSVITSVLSGTGAADTVSAILHSAGMPSYLSDSLLPIILEVSTGCQRVMSGGAPLWVFSAAVGFGGLCVHFQIFSFLAKVRISKLKYLLFRVINAVLSSVATATICFFFNESVPSMALPSGYEFEPTRYSITGGIALVAACVLFALTMLNFSRKYDRIKR